MTRTSSTSIRPFFDADLLDRNIPHYIGFDLSLHPHLLCVGATGTGKTYALKLILGKLAKYHQGISLVICDFKKSGFAEFASCPRGFYGYEDVLCGVELVYGEFTARLRANDQERNKVRVVMLLDEYGAFISSLDKKPQEEAKRQVGSMLMMGRSLGIHLIVGIQRADAEYFRAGARDQFGAILMLGNLSKEQKLMLAPDYREVMQGHNERGQGYLLLDGKGPVRVQVPNVGQPELLASAIRQAVGLRL